MHFILFHSILSFSFCFRNFFVWPFISSVCSSVSSFHFVPWCQDFCMYSFHCMHSSSVFHCTSCHSYPLHCIRSFSKFSFFFPKCILCDHISFSEHLLHFSDFKTFFPFMECNCSFQELENLKFFQISWYSLGVNLDVLYNYATLTTDNLYRKISECIR